MPNRVAVGIKAVLESRIDKWEEGSFCDEMVEDMMRPFINSCISQKKPITPAEQSGPEGTTGFLDHVPVSGET